MSVLDRPDRGLGSLLIRCLSLVLGLIGLVLTIGGAWLGLVGDSLLCDRRAGVGDLRAGHHFMETPIGDQVIAYALPAAH